MKRIAFYGGSFDPVHNGHLAIGRALSELFALDAFFFVPAFHAPHKRDKRVSSPFCRYAMLGLATNNDAKLRISTIELEAPERPYTVETQTKLKEQLGGAQIFFVIGADSWAEIETWREWKKVLTLTNIIVVTRPGHEIAFQTETPEIHGRIVDLRDTGERKIDYEEDRIYITDAVNIDVSSTEIRREVSRKNKSWREKVSPEVAKYIEKYELYI